ncbi:MAG: DUF523 domain-containing protein [Nitrospina sp.]|jgi:uncharacterized protein YbbK (DUF523 family)|nr:DUF523 domain-containing protein [Nitrospina sp.]MBT5632975.1 DUF523 domain-containing protein [Nitrospina sp.]
MAKVKFKIGVSSCLLGEPVRYNGEHKYNQAVIDLLGDRFEAMPVCPEVEMGMGVPREPVQIVMGNECLVGVESGKHWDMNGFNSKKLDELAQQNLSGYIFKSRSPSCGPEGIPVYSETGQAQAETSAGVFAQAFMKSFPSLPVIDEEALQDRQTRENFIARVIEGAKQG